MDYCTGLCGKLLSRTSFSETQLLKRCSEKCRLCAEQAELEAAAWSDTRRKGASEAAKAAWSDTRRTGASEAAKLNLLLPIYFAEAGVASAFLAADTAPPSGVAVRGGSASNVVILLPIYFAEVGVASAILAADTAQPSGIVVRGGSASNHRRQRKQHMRQRRLKLLLPINFAEVGVASAILALNTAPPSEIEVRKGSAPVA